MPVWSLCGPIFYTERCLNRHIWYILSAWRVYPQVLVCHRRLHFKTPSYDESYASYNRRRKDDHIRINLESVQFPA